jgi:large subunit ribosomal protein L20
VTRVKRGVTARKRHKKIIDLATGHRGQRNHLFRRANESVLHALSYATRDRKARKRQFRQLWIVRINAAARLHGLTYSRLMNGLALAGVEIDRKILADLAVRDDGAFGRLADAAKAASGA